MQLHCNTVFSSNNYIKFVKYVQGDPYGYVAQLVEIKVKA